MEQKRRINVEKQKISLVIPMYDEEEVARQCYERVKKCLVSITDYEHEIIFINDGSKDDTFTILSEIAKNDPTVKVISFSRNFGHQASVVAGLQHISGEAIVILDADLQDPPELIPEMLSLWEQGYQVIYGKRKARKGESRFKLLTAKMFYETLTRLSDVDIPKDTGDFRLVDRKVVDAISEMPEHNKFLRGLFSWVGYKQIPFEYERQERLAGKTKYPLKKMIKLASDGIISFSRKPLKLVGLLGIVSVGISFLILVYALISYFFKLNELSSGWTSLMVAITFFAGAQLISLWVISEYIGRIYDEAKQRPEYIIEKTINLDQDK
jgi:dolichol-phosphate mannosyltransferase